MYHIVATIYCYDCSYQDPEGQSMLRVTTVTRRWIDTAVSSEVSYFTLFRTLVFINISLYLVFQMEINDLLINNN